MSKLAKALTAAAGNAGESLYVEDVFSTYLYTGTGSTKTITNGIDLDGEGGLVWIKDRDIAFNHTLADTERGATKFLVSNSTAAEATQANSVTSFNANGFSLGAGSIVNYSGSSISSWTFRKAKKFFDVVTYTGNGVAGRTVAHNLGSTPGFIVVKRTNAAYSWCAWHSGANSGNAYGFLDTTAAFNTNGGVLWGDGSTYSAPTSTEFSVSTDPGVNANGSTYVAYLFASDAGGFGDDGSENIIKCGSYTGTGAAGHEINLGFEPQWVMIKSASVASTLTHGWMIIDNMRGFTATPQTLVNQPALFANLSAAEAGTNSLINITSTGFVLNDNHPDINGLGNEYIYIAIRRPMKTPESGTEVFAVDQGDASTTNPQFVSNFPVDLGIWRNIGAGNNWETSSRLQGSNYMRTNLTTAEAPDADIQWDFMTGFYGPARNTSFYSWMFKRATGFFDVVAYTGTGATPTVINHNLSVAPEMMILKSRTSNENWMIYHSALGNTSALIFNTTAVLTGLNTWNSTTPNATTFTLGGGGNNGSQSGQNYIAYLFATVAGVSKVGSYTGTGSNVDVDCGFSAGARFILIKRTDSTGDWYVWDSVRGIVAGNDPYLLLNSTAAEVTTTDYIDPLASGFTVTSTAPAALNASGGSFVYLAIA